MSCFEYATIWKKNRGQETVDGFCNWTVSNDTKTTVLGYNGI